MKIAFIYLGRRGAGIPISYELVRALTKQVEVLLVHSDHVENPHLWQQLASNSNDRLKRLSTPTYRTIGGAIWSWINQTKIHTLAEQIRLWEPDVQVYPMFYTWNPFLQHRLRDIPSVIAVHDPYPHPGLVDALYRQLENWSIHQAKRCLVFSQNLAPALQRRGAPLDKIDVIPMGEFNIYAQPSTSRPMTQPALKPLLLFFGRITAYKGIEVLLRAYLEVRRTHPAHLQIVGAGDLRPYQTLLDQTPEVQVVNRWIDEQEIAHHFQQATLILLPYTSATQSGVLPIAASFARPVIATRTGGIPEQIIEGKTGLLVEPNSPGQLAQAIRSLLDDPGFARQLGNNLHTDYQLNRSWDQIAARVLMSCDKVYK